MGLADLTESLVLAVGLGHHPDSGSWLSTMVIDNLQLVLQIVIDTFDPRPVEGIAGLYCSAAMANPDMTDQIYPRRPLTCLGAAALHGDFKALLKLTAASLGTADERSEQGYTPAHCAAHAGSVSCLDVLHAADPASLYAQNVHGETPAYIASSQGNNACLVALRDYYAARGACCRSRASCSLSQPNMDGATLVFVACAKGQAETVKLLLQQPPPTPGEDDERGFTALDDSSNRQINDNGFGMDPSRPDNDGTTPAWIAAATGSLECLKLIYGAGGDISFPDAMACQTPLEAALSSGHSSCAEFIQQCQ
jgi:ankyrin repeat protein